MQAARRARSDQCTRDTARAPRRRAHADRTTARTASSAVSCSVNRSRSEPERVVPAYEVATQAPPTRSAPPADWPATRTRSAPGILRSAGSSAPRGDADGGGGGGAHQGASGVRSRVRGWGDLGRARRAAPGDNTVITRGERRASPRLYETRLGLLVDLRIRDSSGRSGMPRVWPRPVIASSSSASPRRSAGPVRQGPGTRGQGAAQRPDAGHQHSGLVPGVLPGQPA